MQDSVAQDAVHSGYPHCSQPEHLISRQIRARTVRDGPAWAGTGAIRFFGY
jgi:hypothetical protein